MNNDELKERAARWIRHGERRYYDALIGADVAEGCEEWYNAIRWCVEQLLNHVEDEPHAVVISKEGEKLLEFLFTSKKLAEESAKVYLDCVGGEQGKISVKVVRTRVSDRPPEIVGVDDPRNTTGGLEVYHVVQMHP